MGREKGGGWEASGDTIGKEPRIACATSEAGNVRVMWWFVTFLLQTNKQ